MEREIKLIKAEYKDLNAVLQMQREAFSKLYEKYGDTQTSPAMENYEDILRRFTQRETVYYFITTNGERVGVIRIVDFKDGITRKRISPIFIMEKYRNRGYAQRALTEAERIHGKSNWELDTILQEKANCYLYEKLGYRQTGKYKVINDKMTLVFYEKD